MLTPGINYVGGSFRVAVSFADDSGNPVDPTTVTFTTRSPNSSSSIGPTGVGFTTYKYGVDAALVKSAVGNYYVDVGLTTPGRWFYQWLTTGVGTTTALEGDFLVQRSRFQADAFLLDDYA